MPAGHFLRHNWPAITIGVTAVAIACAAIVMLSNMPPRVIVMATGPEGDTYHDIASAIAPFSRAPMSRCNSSRRQDQWKISRACSTRIRA